MYTIEMNLEMARAIAMISRIDFTLAECATSTQAKYIARKMRNFLDVRTEEEFKKKFEFYGMHSVANGVSEFTKFAEEFAEIGKSYNGVAVNLIEV